jgi:hypothetical protein
MAPQFRAEKIATLVRFPHKVRWLLASYIPYILLLYGGLYGGSCGRLRVLSARCQPGELLDLAPFMAAGAADGLDPVPPAARTARRAALHAVALSLQKKGTESLSESGVKRMRGGAKRQCERALAVLRAARVVALTPSPLPKAALRYELFAVSNHSGGTGGGHCQHGWRCHLGRKGQQ